MARSNVSQVQGSQVTFKVKGQLGSEGLQLLSGLWGGLSAGEIGSNVTVKLRVTESEVTFRVKIQGPD